MTTHAGELDRLGTAKYVLLTTRRRDGTTVPTPVWVAHDGAALVIWTATDAGKVKRIRRDPAVTVAPCDARGKPRGSAVSGTATVLDADATERVRQLIQRKYGIAGRVAILGSRLRRGRSGTVGVAVTLDQQQP
ncbi:PPOX class F420-dependent oxidoreductase [Rhodococcus sp. X156]|uniref:PPOX class F420-dependent oxidoreductase n=1 Tax=Rhodococcus sp. X156 TaxID=2499145 RepID=UPI000FDC279D|nr:PPOX class F420-dependent oxidoreductase [Rhodococcus sp. X156]